MNCPARATHKAGTTFDRASQLDVTEYGATGEGHPVLDLTGWSGKCELRHALTGALIADLGFAWLDPAQRLYRLRVPETSHWPICQAELDIKLTSPAGDEVTTPTEPLSIIKQVTQ